MPLQEFVRKLEYEAQQYAFALVNIWFFEFLIWFVNQEKKN